MIEDLTYEEYQELLLKVKWKTSVCVSGESCWCRIIEPEIPILDENGNEMYIAPSGTLPQIFAEHLVKIHNENLKNND